MSQLCCVFCVHDDVAYFAEAGLNLRVICDPALFALVSRTSWHGKAGDWERAARIAESVGTTVIVGDWTDEREQRQAAINHVLSLGYTHALIPDGDEIIEPRLLDALIRVAENELADRVYVTWDTYWKSPEYVIRPRERFTPCYLIDLRVAKPTGGRNFDGGRPLFLGPEYGIVHHLSWVGPERRIRRKLETWGHAKEVLPGWYQRVWKGWDRDRGMRNLHPTHPEAYAFAERIPVPEILRPAWERYRELADDEEKARVLLPASAPPLSATVTAAKPKVSVVIPVFGGADDLTACLDSLAVCRDASATDGGKRQGKVASLLHEVLVVDDGTPAEGGEADAIAAAVARHASFARLVRTEENRGFAAASNRGAAEADPASNLLLFLNSDTVVPRAGLVRLVEALYDAGPLCAAAGSYTNRAGHGQQIEPTYTDLSTLDLFAADFARRDPEGVGSDSDTDMLVGFCLLIRKDILNSLGSEPFDTRFGAGTFEDNDLCYRLRRAGYRLVRAGRAFVHHAGSKTLTRALPDVEALLARNHTLYRQKWAADLSSGFSSHLSGLAPSAEARIIFDPAHHPDQRTKEIRRLAREADIALVMIVKNEERVLGAALQTAMPYFAETIVVDTGSTDRTVEIAEAAGAKVFSFPWTDSFSEARNESLRHATGHRWFFWMDADDTLTPEAGEALLKAALSGPDDIAAFVVPVQFVETDNGDGTVSPGGTRVDHVKLIRNYPGLVFEGRIHEQILPSLRAVAGQDARIARAPEEAVVLHSGYDTSAEGQKKKRARDAKLLALDLEERPGHPFVLFNLGMTDHYGGEHEGAVKWLRECIAVSGQGESHLRKAYALLAVSLRELDRSEEALATIEEGLAAVGDNDPELHFHAGFLLTAAGRYAEARTHYEATLASGADLAGYFSSVDRSILGYKTFHNLGQVCLLAGDYEAAKKWWLRATEDAPRFLPSAFDLFTAATERGDFIAARRALGAVEQTEGLSENWATMAARLADTETCRGGGKAAGEGGASPSPGMAGTDLLARVLEGHPQAISVQLTLARRLLASGEETAAAPHLATLADAGVAEGAFCLGVSATRRGDFAEALAWMERALALNPDHEPTREQVENLKQALAAEQEGNAS